MTSKTRTRIALTVILAVVFGTAGYWFSLKPDREFIGRVQQEIGQGVNELDLSKLMPGPWETVCNIHGYDGPTYIEKYKKTYPPAAQAQDGAWGLTFINADGSYTSVAGSTADGFSFNFGCLPKNFAKLARKSGSDKLWVAKRKNGS